jgi:hypothetical protein
MRVGVIIGAAFFLVGCSSGDSELRDLNVRRAVEIEGAGYEPSPSCNLVGSVSMPEQDLSSLGSATGGAEVDFIHELSGKALRMGGNLVVPAAGVSTKMSASSGSSFSGDVYHCPR